MDSTNHFCKDIIPLLLDMYSLLRHAVPMRRLPTRILFTKEANHPCSRNQIFRYWEQTKYLRTQRDMMFKNSITKHSTASSNNSARYNIIEKEEVRSTTVYLSWIQIKSYSVNNIIMTSMIKAWMSHYHMDSSLTNSIALKKKNSSALCYPTRLSVHRFTNSRTLATFRKCQIITSEPLTIYPTNLAQKSYNMKRQLSRMIFLLHSNKEYLREWLTI